MHRHVFHIFSEIKTESNGTWNSSSKCTFRLETSRPNLFKVTIVPVGLHPV